MNTKNIIPFSLLVLLLLTDCSKKDDDMTTSPVDVNGTHITIEEVIAYIPPALRKENTVLYKDKNGTEKWLKTVYFETDTPREEYGISYTHDQLLVRLFDESNPDFEIEIGGAGLYLEDKTIQKSIGVLLVPGHEAASLTLVIDDRFPLWGSHTSFEPSIEMQGKIFENVYMGIVTPGLADAYSEIDINTTEGVVAFRDGANDLWVFERFGE